MIELLLYGALFLAVMLALIGMAETETMQEYAERLHVNRLADRSRKRKPQSVRPRSRYIEVLRFAQNDRK